MIPAIHHKTACAAEHTVVSAMCIADQEVCHAVERHIAVEGLCAAATVQIPLGVLIKAQIAVEAVGRTENLHLAVVEDMNSAIATTVPEIQFKIRVHREQPG